MKLSEIWGIDSGWTLFLDRDGVINKRKIGDYIYHQDEFQFFPGTLNALKELAAIFPRIIVVTNQQGIGKGLMTESDLQSIHDFMKTKVLNAGGRIDAVYFSPNLALENSNTRKPAIGMALAAKKQFPEIVFTKSVIAGDSPSDMQFGRNAGMKTVYINTDGIKIDENLKDIEVTDLGNFVEILVKFDQNNA
jgi:histidinol-phosphate phosphatase family protein